jgi:uncharacterized lipoprotein YmbA
MRFRILAQLIVLAAGFVLGGCVEIGGASTPPRFYLLTPQAPVHDGVGDPDLGLGVGPIRMPVYLDRPQIVTRGADSQLVLAEFDRWAEPLEESVGRVLAADLARRLGTDRVQRHPWRASRAVELAVEVDVVRFDGRRGEAVVLEAHWRLRSEDALVQRVSRIEEATQDDGYAELASAMSRALSTLSAEIANGVTAARP